MLEITGKYGTARIMTDFIDKNSWSQLYKTMSAGISEGTHVVVMPDCHSGANCVIGFTQTLNRSNPRLCPNLIGVDIGCNITSICLPLDPVIEKEDRLRNLDAFIRSRIGISTGTYAEQGLSAKEKALLSREDLRIFEEMEKMLRLDGGPRHQMKRPILKQLKSVGSGNHFIELGKDSKGLYWLTIHSGSRNLGLTVAQIYQHHAVEYCSAHCENDIKYLDPGSPYYGHYLYALAACRRFSECNHRLILRNIADYLLAESRKKPLETIGTMHNYLDFDDMTIRKGAVKAVAGKKLLIPFNMRDGIAICTGKGNADWNFSAPHGAGRLLSRAEAKQQLDLETTKVEMAERGIFTTSLDYCVDETANAYKPKDEILERIIPTVSVDDMIAPIYNIKGRS